MKIVQSVYSYLYGRRRSRAAEAQKLYKMYKLWHDGQKMASLLMTFMTADGQSARIWSALFWHYWQKWPAAGRSAINWHSIIWTYTRFWMDDQFLAFHILAFYPCLACFWHSK